MRICQSKVAGAQYLVRSCRVEEICFLSCLARGFTEPPYHFPPFPMPIDPLWNRPEKFVQFGTQHEGSRHVQKGVDDRDTFASSQRYVRLVFLWLLYNQNVWHRCNTACHDVIFARFSIRSSIKLSCKTEPPVSSALRIYVAPLEICSQELPSYCDNADIISRFDMGLTKRNFLHVLKDVKPQMKSCM